MPSLRVDPELRQAAESVLQEGETLSVFIEASVRESIERRRTRAEFMARGLTSRDEAMRSGLYIPADEVTANSGGCWRARKRSWARGRVGELRGSVRRRRP